MIGFGALAGLFALFALYATRKKRIPTSTWFLRGAIAMPFLPLIGIGIGWIFTEMARQPWVVFGLMRTQDGVSPTVSAGEVLTSLVVFTILYAFLAVIEFGLLTNAIKVGPPDHVAITENVNEDNVLTFAY